VVTAPLDLSAVWQVLRTVPDPEIPVLALADLGVIRHVRLHDGQLEVGLTPTYSGCPATSVIRADVRAALVAAGFEAQIVDVLSPPWSSTWITDEGRAKLRAYGIAPPTAANDVTPSCPLCGSADTELLSEFGSTPCKALHRCRQCLEPFDRFKCI
jgi:ring-1,2-phenylacetyl-CoA epoxidase subunit PaaD